jgi:hypothetical protein
MSESSNEPQDPANEEAVSHASTGRNVEESGGGRTEGETSVDEALGDAEERTD